MKIRFFRPASALAISACLTAPAPAQEPLRSLGAHEHGHGALNIAIEGTQVLIELRAPGNDIVGFEHPAHTDEDRRAVEKARATLKAPLTLFALPVDAGCRVSKATVILSTEGEHEHEKKEHDAHEKHGEHEKHEGHTEFRAEYALSCARPQAIRRLEFPFFRLFPRSRELAVTVLTAHGQTAYEVERDSPAIELKQAP